MVHLEIDSFVVKFKNLCSAGYKATLALDVEDGKASVCLRANLGHVPPQPYRPPHHVYRGPSYHCRQERRKAAKSAAASAALSNNIIGAEVDTSDQAEEAQIKSTVVSVQDKIETQEAEEAIEDSKMQETVESVEKVSENFEC